MTKTINPETGKKQKKHRLVGKVSACMLVSTLTLLFWPAGTKAAVNFSVNGTSTLEIIEMLTIMALIPSILIMTSCFTRIIIVLSFLRSALGLQQTPPNQVLIGIALFLTLFTMSPVISDINKDAYQPYKQEQITQEEFIQKASVPLKEFMLKNTKKTDISLFRSLSKTDSKTNVKDLPITVVIPAFMTSELKRAFIIGFLLYIPFMVIDIIVSSTLMSMGMIMLPPTMISLPFKILLFIIVDGWDLLFKALVTGFNL
jgi:flagellar biosynthetic protein FliP